MIDRDDERMLALLRGELTGEALDALLDDAERDPAVAGRLADWQTLAGLAVDEHVEATRPSAFAAFEARLAASEANGLATSAHEESLLVTAERRATTSAGSGNDRTYDRAHEARSPSTSNTWFDRAKQAWHRWRAGGAAGLQPVLLALVLAQAGAISWMLHDRGLAPQSESAAPVYRGGGNPCEQAVVALAPGASVDELMQWLGMHNATMNGPDANGRFTLVASDPAALRALLADPQAERLLAAPPTQPAACAGNR